MSRIRDEVREIFGHELPAGDPAWCQECGAMLKDPALVYRVEFGFQNDGPGRCASCKCKKSVRDARVWRELLSDMGIDGELSCEPDANRYQN